MSNTDAATVGAKKQLVKPNQRMELWVTLAVMEALLPEWSITRQDHNICSKMPLREGHLQQLSFSLMLTLGSWEAAQPELPCSLCSPYSWKILTCSYSSSQALFHSPLPSYSISDLSAQSLLCKLTSRLYLKTSYHIFLTYRHFLAQFTKL